MKHELAPSLSDAALASHPPRRLLGVALLSLLAAALFYAPLVFGGALHGHDWSSHHYHYFDWVRISLTSHHTLPLYMADAWVTPNFLANAEAPTLGPLAWLLLVLPTGAYIKLLIVVFAAAGLAGMALLLRDLGVAAPVTAPLAILFAFNGFFVSHLAVGHHWAMGAYLLPGLLALYRRAALGSGAALWGAAAINAFTILGGQHQPFIWQNLLLSFFAGLWALRVGALFPLTRWALLLLATAGLGALKLLPMLFEFGDYAPTARTDGLPPALLLATLSGRGQHAALSHPAVAYEHGAGWWEYAGYVGPLGLVCLVAAFAALRAGWPLLAIGVLFLLLSLESSPLWSLLRDLPVMRSQRGPSRFLFLALFSFSVVGGVGLARLWGWAQPRWPRGAAAVAGLLALLLAADLFAESLPWQRAALGEPIASLAHRPLPLVVGAPQRGRAELQAFAPNRLVYRVEAERPTRVVLPLRFGKRSAEWQVDGLLPVSDGERLAVDVPAGEREVVLRFRPPYLRAGAAVSVATLLLLAGRLLRRRLAGAEAG